MAGLVWHAQVEVLYGHASFHSCPILCTICCTIPWWPRCLVVFRKACDECTHVWTGLHSRNACNINYNNNAIWLITGASWFLLILQPIVPMWCLFMDKSVAVLGILLCSLQYLHKERLRHLSSTEHYLILYTFVSFNLIFTQNNNAKPNYKLTLKGCLDPYWCEVEALLNRWSFLVLSNLSFIPYKGRKWKKYVYMLVCHNTSEWNDTYVIDVKRVSSVPLVTSSTYHASLHKHSSKSTNCVVMFVGTQELTGPVPLPVCSLPSQPPLPPPPGVMPSTRFGSRKPPLTTLSPCHVSSNDAPISSWWHSKTKMETHVVQYNAELSTVN